MTATIATTGVFVIAVLATRVGALNPLLEIVPKLLRGAGYPLQVHEITSQGYVMMVHRMPRPGRPAVLLVHGLVSSSLDWVFTGPNKALGYLLYDAGVDVWMANLRGTPCAMKHSFLKPTQKKFWDFSFHEHGLYDIMDMTDYILNVTGQQRIQYVGNSMGGSAVLAGLSERPEYNEKFQRVILFAPGARMKYASGGVAQAARYRHMIERVADELGITNIPMVDNNEFLKLLYRTCKRKDGPSLCLPLVHWFVGENLVVNYTEFVEISRYYPVSTSMKTVFHLMQQMGSDAFSQYDYGGSGNLRRYGSTTPPSYHLNRVTAPTLIYYCEADNLVTPQDIDWLKTQLPNVVKMFHYTRPDFLHLSFLWHPNVTDLVYLDLVKLVTGSD